MLAPSTFSARSMPLPELLGRDSAAFGDTIVSGMQLDSRSVRPGDLFLALPGEQHDGRQFIEQAVASGAVAVLSEPSVAGFLEAVPVPLIEVPDLRFEAGALAARFYRNPSHSMQVTGITGTNGKTTTSRIIAQLTRALGKPCGVIGTLGAALEESIAAASNTTPDALSLQRQLAEWFEQDVLAVSMEVSSHALEQGRVNGVAFDTAIYTNLSHDHLDYHGSMDAYGRAKKRLFTVEGLRHAIINVDDPFGASIKTTVAANVQVLTYSASGASADVRVKNAEFHADGVRGDLHTPWGAAPFFSPFPGDFNVENFVAAVTALMLAGEDLRTVLDAATRLQPVPGRMQAIANTMSIQVIVDYAHTPQALEQVLNALRPHVPGSLITVFGCGGDRDKEKRQQMGRIACALSDRTVVTSDNPRSEDPLDIMHEIKSGCDGDYLLQADRAKAIALAVGEAQAGDCVLIAGKGHESYQLIDGQRLYFSDEAHARDALAQRALS